LFTLAQLALTDGLEGGSGKSICNDAINAVSRAIRIPKQEMCGHGFKAMVFIILAERLHMPQVIILENREILDFPTVIAGLFVDHRVQLELYRFHQ
jgi:hypothetical protein